MLAASGIAASALGDVVAALPLGDVVVEHLLGDESVWDLALPA
jgi:hypothetical protein